MATKRSIILNGMPTRYNEEGVAAEAITPGQFVKGVTSISKQTSNAQTIPRTIACEREEMGDDIDVDYAIGDTVKIASCAPGTVVLAWIPSGQNVAADAFLDANNAGQLVAGTTKPVARALEASGAVTVPTRLRVEII
jgi:hypothetical protein